MIIEISRQNEDAIVYHKKVDAIVDFFKQNYNCVLLEEYNLRSHFCFMRVDNSTEYIIVEHIENMRETKKRFQGRSLTIDRQHQEQTIVKMPNIILIKDF